MEAPSSLKEYVEAQDKLARDARELFPYDFSTCSWTQGYVKQQVFACLTCQPVPNELQRGGVCYSCSITCHGDHELVELFDRRAFRCDCGSDRLGGTACQIRKDVIPVNVENSYNRNYENIFCTCRVKYNPDTEDGTMFQCLQCEDWFHERCIEELNRIPHEDDFEHFICQTCVGEHSWLLRYRGDPLFACLPEDLVHANGLQDPAHVASPSERIQNGKRRQQEAPETSPRSKVIKTSHAELIASESSTKYLPSDVEAVACRWERLPVVESSLQALFLLEDFRTRMCYCTSCKDNMASCPAIMIEEEVYDPPEDEDGNESTFDAGTRAMEATLQSMPREKAIEGIMAFNKLKDHITSCLKPLVESGEIVTKEHVATFFAGQR